MTLLGIFKDLLNLVCQTLPSQTYWSLLLLSLGYVFAAMLYILKIVGPVFYNYLNPVVLEAVFLGGVGVPFPCIYYSNKWVKS